MKKIKHLALLFLAALVLFAGCEKDEEGNVIVASMKAKIDGALWTSIVRVTVHEDGYFNITGTALSGKVLNITVLGETTGTYSLAPQSGSFQSFAIYKEDDSAAEGEAGWYKSYGGGTVELTKVDTENRRISGTFSFTAKATPSATETVEITQGEFTDLKYQEGNSSE